MPFEGEQLLAGGGVPQLDCAIKLPVASRFPSGEKATDQTELECPLRVSSSWPVAASHSLTVPSELPVASRFPSGEKATE